MRLLRIAKQAWEVIAPLDANLACDVIDALNDLAKNNNGAVQMLNLLLRRVPEHGPAFHNRDQVKKLRDKIFEFRTQPKKGPKVRVLAFRHGQALVVCCSAFEKRGENISDEIDRAVAVRNRYLSAVDDGDIQIDD